VIMPSIDPSMTLRAHLQRQDCEHKLFTSIAKAVQELS